MTDCTDSEIAPKPADNLSAALPSGQLTADGPGTGHEPTLIVPKWSPVSSLPRARDTSQRGSRTYSRFHVPTGPQELSLAAPPDAQLPENWYKIMAEREEFEPGRHSC
jgi:hypothetical protein